MTKKKQVSIFYGGFTFIVGGVNIHLQSLRDGLEQQGYQVNVYTLDSLPLFIKYLPHFAEKLINFFKFPLGFAYKGIVTKMLFKFFFGKQADYFVFEDIYLSWNTNVPSITMLHAVWSDNLQSFKVTEKQVRALKQKEIQLIECIHHPIATVSQPYLDFLQMDHFAGQVSAPIYHLPLGINQADFIDIHKIPSTNKNIIYIGALESRKNVIFLLEVFKKLFELDNSYALTIIGDGPDRNIVEQFIATHNLPVRLLGRISHLAVVDQLFKHDLYLHSSTKESFSYALLEAKLAGLTTFAYEGLQVPAEFIDIKISNYNEDQWFDAIINNNSIPGKIDSNKYTIEAMSSNTITLAG
tara:strand:- start:2054 stop:3115 length:1062 start_codon:yes stop_codon:yes gene_type:complete